MLSTPSKKRAVMHDDARDGQKDVKAKENRAVVVKRVKAAAVPPAGPDYPRNTTMPDPLPKYDAASIGCIKIVTWNVTSIAAATKKGFWRYMAAEDADIICLQETKLAHVPNGNGNSHDTATWMDQSLMQRWPYRYFSSSQDKKGYSGSAVLSKLEPISVVFGIPSSAVAEFRDDKEGRCIALNFPTFHLVACYVPNAGDKLVRLDRRMFWDRDLHAYIRELDADKPTMFAGDLNVAHRDIDLARPDSNHLSAGFTDEERSNFSQLLGLPFPETLLATGESSVASEMTAGHEFVDTYRHFHPNDLHPYTYFSYRFQCRSKALGWRLDYFVASRRLLERVVSSEIRRECWGASDHVPLVMVLKVGDSE